MRLRAFGERVERDVREFVEGAGACGAGALLEEFVEEFLPAVPQELPFGDGWVGGELID